MRIYDSKVTVHDGIIEGIRLGVLLAQEAEP